MKRYVLFTIYLLLSLSLNGFAFQESSASGTTTIITLTPAKLPADGASAMPTISPNGWFIGFTSTATNLVAGHTGTIMDAFLADTQAGTIELISVSSGGEQGNLPSYAPAVSAGGRFAVFESEAYNLASNHGTSAGRDIFLRDRQAQTTTLISVNTSGNEGAASSMLPSISADGRFIAFYSTSSDMVIGDTNGYNDVFVRDSLAGVTELVSVSDSGVQGDGHSNTGFSNSISADGRYVVFQSSAANLIDGVTDTNGFVDIFVRDRTSHKTVRATVPLNPAEFTDGTSSFPSISGDGRYVVFYSEADNLVDGDTNGKGDIFIRDLVAGTTKRVSVSTSGAEGDNISTNPAISADGRFVGFTSLAANLVGVDSNGVNDTFLRDLQGNITELVSVSSNGVQGNGVSSGWPGVADGGQRIVFASLASNLVAGDNNNAMDIFLRTRSTNNTHVYLPAIVR